MSNAGSIRFLVAEPITKPRRWSRCRQPIEVIYEEDEPVKECENIVKITDIRQIGPRSLLIKWTSSPIPNIDGYEICVNGEIASRVFSRTRNSCVLDLSEKIRNAAIYIYAVYKNERVVPPDTIKYTLSCY